MLALTRKIGETVVATDPQGNELRVTVREVSPGRVRLAFDGPAFKVYREELHQATPLGRADSGVVDARDSGNRA